MKDKKSRRPNEPYLVKPHEAFTDDAPELTASVNYESVYGVPMAFLSLTIKKLVQRTDATVRFNIDFIPEAEHEKIAHGINSLLNSGYSGDIRHRFLNYYDLFCWIEDRTITESHKIMTTFQDALNIQARPLHSADQEYHSASTVSSRSRAMNMTWITLRLLSPITAHLYVRKGLNAVLDFWMESIIASRYADFFWHLSNRLYPHICKTDSNTARRFKLKQYLIVDWLIRQFVYIHPVTELSVTQSTIQCRKYLDEYLTAHGVTFEGSNYNDDIGVFGSPDESR